MLNFRISTLLAVTAAFAILFLFVTLPGVAIATAFGVLAIAMIYGLTAPADGTILDVASRPGVQFLIHLWAMATVLIVLLMIACIFSTDLRCAVDRARYRQWIKKPTIADPPGVSYGVRG
jgi:hypothetical protein